jgi:thiamine biosynthesis lipoprotein
MAAELRFPTMGSDAHLIVVGGPATLATTARDRVVDLERRWSRFLPDSEVSRLTAHSGDALIVSPDTVELVERSVSAWRLTGGMFDPTVLGDVVRAGYDRSFEQLPPTVNAVASPLQAGCVDIEVIGPTVRLPSGTGFDPGGIGKGLAADIVAQELMHDGAAGVCVNLGGDLRVAGEAQDGGAWTIVIEHPGCDRPIARVGLSDGAVATSTTLRRRWLAARGVNHHVIDPSTGLPSESDLTLASVVAAEGWLAEVLAKAVLLRGSARAFDLMDGTPIEALAVDQAGRIVTSPGFTRFTGGVPLAAHLEDAA